MGRRRDLPGSSLVAALLLSACVLGPRAAGAADFEFVEHFTCVDTVDNAGSFDADLRLTGSAITYSGSVQGTATINGTTGTSTGTTVVVFQDFLAPGNQAVNGNQFSCNFTIESNDDGSFAENAACSGTTTVGLSAGKLFGTWQRTGILVTGQAGPGGMTSVYSTSSPTVEILTFPQTAPLESRQSVCARSGFSVLK
jgi:hypothetical protein